MRTERWRAEIFCAAGRHGFFGVESEEAFGVAEAELAGLYLGTGGENW